MLNSRNIQDVLTQATKSVSTTSKSILSVAITLPDGSLLSSYTTPNNEQRIPINKLKLVALSIQQQLYYQSEDVAPGSVEKLEDKEAQLEYYAKLIPDTEFSLIIITELNYPDGIINLKFDALLEALKELEKFSYSED